jgi:methylthioribose-1-phosphate isomerase
MSAYLDRTVDWREGENGRPEVVMIDQTRLPAEYALVAYTGYRDVGEAIATMVVRGAPAIGAAAALGLALAAYEIEAGTGAAFMKRFAEAAGTLAATRPTAVNLFWAIERMTDIAKEASARSPFDLADARARLKAAALGVLDSDEADNRSLGAHGASLLLDGARVLTHCNAGALACVGYGTALGVIRAAVEQGKRIAVYADETRPRLQGMKLTAWELARDGIDVTVICDNMAAYLMSRGEIDAVVVGADRIAANGDAANKIGTYGVAVLADAHSIPFYIAAPLSTVDFRISDGSRIPIEQRDAEEVTIVGGTRIAPDSVKVLNHAFDVTPARLISAIVTERGIALPEYGRSLAALSLRGG